MVETPDLAEDYLDLSDDPHVMLKVKERGSVLGTYQFGAQSGELDGRLEVPAEGNLRLVFTFEGNDELDPVNGTISGWQGSLSDLSEIRDFGDIPCFEVFLAEEEYDQVKKILAMELDADLVLHGATSVVVGIVLRGTASDLGAFADCLTFHLGDLKTAKRRRVSERVLEAVQIVMGKCSSS